MLRVLGPRPEIIDNPLRFEPRLRGEVGLVLFGRRCCVELVIVVLDPVLEPLEAVPLGIGLPLVHVPLLRLHEVGGQLGLHEAEDLHGLDQRQLFVAIERILLREVELKLVAFRVGGVREHLQKLNGRFDELGIRLSFAQNHFGDACLQKH